jgi:transposase
MPPKKEADMELYAAIDLHSNNSVLVVTDSEDHVVFAKRLRNELEMIVTAMRSCTGEIRAVAVESTYNWSWLVDGLQDAGFDVRLANTAAIKQYDGLKHGDVFSDGRHLAKFLRLEILPEGYICPRELRALRDLMRKRAQLVRQRTEQILIWPPRVSWREGFSRRGPRFEDLAKDMSARELLSRGNATRGAGSDDGSL